MQKDYRNYLPRLVDAAVQPEEGELSHMERFLSPKDGLVRLALSDTFTEGELRQELEGEPDSILGRMLKETLVSWKL